MSLLIKISLMWAAAIVVLLVVWKIIIARGRRDHFFVSIDPTAPRAETERMKREQTFKQSA